jgi:hypothetical protein
MPEIRYVVLSDLHFGATNSVLTRLAPSAHDPGGFVADCTRASPLLDPVLNGLRHLTENQSEPPTLILAGDVLDLALSPDEVSATTFGHFADLAFGDAGGRGPVFGPVVYYLPGNHDHHLWEGERELNYASYIRELPPDQTIEAPFHTTHLRPERLRSSTASLMASLLRRRPGCDDIAVRVAYPNLALVSESSDRVRVVTHGHFIESIYSLMSRLRDVLFPDQARQLPPPTVESLESENFAWIDFFWSTLGRSGQVGVDVGLIYADLDSTVNLGALATNLANGIAARLRSPAYLRPVEAAALRFVLRREVQHVARSERGQPGVVLAQASRDGLRAFLEGPVLRQMRTELGSVPADVGVVFGHTHKPFVGRWDLQGYPGPVAISNDGGWVVDTSTAAATQGAAAVLLDEHLNTVNLQFYRQAAGGTAPVEVVAPPGDGPNLLLDQLTKVIDPGAEPWRSVSSAAAALIAERWKLQSNLMTVAAAKRSAPANTTLA